MKLNYTYKANVTKVIDEEGLSEYLLAKDMAKKLHYS